MSKSTGLTAERKANSVRPAKPRPDFPLYAHKTRRWAKKVRGRTLFFGPWEDPQGALEKWLDQKDDLLAGRTPRAKVEGGVTLALVVDQFLVSKRRKVEAGELTPRSWGDYYATCANLIKSLGGKGRLVADLAADDFERLRSSFANRLGATRLGNEIQRVRTVFKYAFEAGIINTPVRFGPAFVKPSAKTMRQERNAKGLMMFEAADLRRIIDTAGVPLKAMILLAANCGFGNHDVATLPLKAVDMKGGWIDHPRPKTAVARRCKLWPETVKALEAATAKRPTPKSGDDDGLAFVTKYGGSWAKGRKVTTDEDGSNPKVAADNPVSKEFTKLLKELGLHRPGMGFYCLRRGFETIGGDSRDQVAVDHVMGHAPPANDMAAVYRQKISDERREAVAEHVRAWLFPKPKKVKAARKEKTPKEAVAVV